MRNHRADGDVHQMHMGGEDAERPTKGMPQGKPALEKVIEKQDDDDLAENKQAPSAPRPSKTEPHPQA